MATYTLHIIQNFYQLFHIANVYLVWLAALKLNISVKYDALHFQYLQRKIKLFHKVGFNEISFFLEIMIKMVARKEVKPKFD